MAEPAAPEIQSAPEFRPVEPLIKTRGFEIYALSTDPNGIEIVPGSLLPRPNAKSILAAQGEYGQAILGRITSDISTREVPSVLKEVLEGSLSTTQEKARLALMQQTLGLTDEQMEEYKKKLSEGKLTDHSLLSGADRSTYVHEYENTQKIGFFNPQISPDGKRLKLDMRKVPFVMYKHIRTEEDEKRGLLELANPCGCAIVLETNEADGNNFFGMGRRRENNGSYRATTASGGQPGAWAAGLMDLNFSRKTEPGLPQKFTNTQVFNIADKELKEETGVSSTTYEGDFPTDVKSFAYRKIKDETGATQGDIENIKINSFGKDMVARHNEIGLVAKAKWSREKLTDIYNNMPKSDSLFNFSEDVFFIPATKDAVAKFVTQCKIPMPWTHYMPLIGAMVEKIIVAGKGSAEARKEAEEWRVATCKGIDDNLADIDRMVTEYYKDNPKAIEENMKEAKADKIRTDGFEPRVLADRQVMRKGEDGKYSSITLNGELIRLGFPQAA